MTLLNKEKVLNWRDFFFFDSKDSKVFVKILQKAKHVRETIFKFCWNTNFLDHESYIGGASKIKLKNVNKKIITTDRKLIFCNFSRHPLLIKLHCCFHHYKTLKAVVTATAAIVVLTPANFDHFWRPKFNFQPLSFIFKTFGKKLAETKIVARFNVKKIKAKYRKKRLLNRLRWSGNDFLPKFVNNGESWQFFGPCWGFAEMLWVNISS